jgi:hypothetical protein
MYDKPKKGPEKRGKLKKKSFFYLPFSFRTAVNERRGTDNEEKYEK